MCSPDQTRSTVWKPPFTDPWLATFRRSYRATPAWWPPPPHPTHPDLILTPFLTRFRPEFDPILTSWGDLGSKLGQIQVEIGSERGSKSGRGEWGVGVGVVRPEWLCSSSKSCDPWLKEHFGESRVLYVGVYHSKSLDYDINSPRCFDVMHMKSLQNSIPPEFSDVMIT